jgi:hypothetical protein
MTTPNHIAISFSITYWILAKIRIKKWERILIAIVLGITGGLPDILAAIDSLKGDWGLYEILHRFQWWHVPVWPYGLHLFFDWLTHSPDGGRGPAYIPLEIASWILLTVGWLLYFGVVQKWFEGRKE